MKKFILSLFMVLFVLMLVGCAEKKPVNPEEPGDKPGTEEPGENPENPEDNPSDEPTISEEIKVVVPQGNPFIAVGNLIGEENIKIDPVNGAQGVKTALVGNDYDIVIAPLNLGAQLYSKNNSVYELDSVIALGNTYIVSKAGTKLDSLEDLQGKTILAYSQNGTPDIVLRYVLGANQIEATIEYQQSLTEVVPLFVQGSYDYILAAEPVITNLQVKKNIQLNIINLQDYTKNTIMQAAIFVNPNSTKQESIDLVIKKIEENIKEMNENPEVYANKIVSKDIYFEDLGKEIIAQSLPKANLAFLKAKDNKDKVETYLTMINYELPKEDFYR